jgi:hypothetical protein
VAVTGSIGIAAGLEDTSNGIAVGLLQLLVVCLLTSILALTIGLAASIGRGYLPGFGALIGLVAISQVAVLFGSGGWFPFAAPALWSVSWQDPTITISPAQFVLVVATGIAGMWLTVTWWTRFEVVLRQLIPDPGSQTDSMTSGWIEDRGSKIQNPASGIRHQSEAAIASATETRVRTPKPEPPLST